MVKHVDSEMAGAKVALHNIRDLQENMPVAAEDLKLIGNGQFFAEQAMRLTEVGERADAIIRIQDEISKVLSANVIATNPPINNINDLRTFDKIVRSGAYIPVGGDIQKADNLQEVLYAVEDGFAVATLVGLSDDPSTSQLIKGKTTTDIEADLGVTGNLVGLGEVIQESAVFDSNIRTEIYLMQKRMTRDKFDLQAMNETLKAIETAVRTGSDRREADMMIAYLSSIILDAEDADAKAQLRKENLPNNLDEQLTIARDLLESLEVNIRPTSNFNVGDISRKLDALLQRKDLLPEVAVEIRSRMKLHDCYVLMRKAGGWIVAPEDGGDPECRTIGDAANLARGLGHELDNESINFFLKTSANGIPVALAWDLFQILNCDYRNQLNIIDPSLVRGLKTVVDNDAELGTVDATYITDAIESRKILVDEEMIRKIMSTANVDNDVAKKAWEMAKKLSTATGEDSIFNAAQSGNDQMAEILYFKLYRKSRERAGRARGPDNTLNDVVGMGNSWLRRVSGVAPYNKNDLGIPLLSKDVVVTPNPDRKLGIEDSSFQYNMGVLWTTKLQPLKELLLNREPDISKIANIEFMQKAVDYFNKGDPDKSKHLREIWVKGVLGLVTSYARLGWSQPDIDKFEQWLTTDLSIELENGKGAGPFLKQSEWNAIEANGSFKWRMLKLRGLANYRKYVDGPGGKR